MPFSITDKKIIPACPKSVTALQLISLVIIFILSGCSAQNRIHNTFIEVQDHDKREYPDRLKDFSDTGDMFIGLSFSGGGTRAAAFSYGVLSELRDTMVTIDNKNIRLLDEVDHISSVSGGSFTAAYYGLFGDRIFDDFETVFLRKNVQKTLINSIFNPINWFRFMSAGFDRGEIAVDYFDSQIFEGKTFGDLADREGPFIQINATDLGTGQAFDFTHEAFDALCSDLYDFKIARAVAASSAVPVVFPPITLKNYPGCESTNIDLIQSIGEKISTDVRIQTLVKDLSTYAEKDRRKYIHLVDGGIADNLGLRSMLYRMILLNKIRKRIDPAKADAATLPKFFVIILVNAQTNRTLQMEQSPEVPSSIQVLSAASAVQIVRSNQETILQIKQLFKNTEEKISSEGQHINIFFVELKFNDIPDRKTRNIFNNMVTSFSLPDDQVDMLYESGRTLLKDSKEFQRLLQSLKSVEE